jgi:hypothetical protein
MSVSFKYGRYMVQILAVDGLSGDSYGFLQSLQANDRIILSNRS